MKKYLALFLFLSIIAGDQPDTLNFGYTNILEGGPTHPSYGLYLYPYAAYYHTNTFKDQFGRRLGSNEPNFDLIWGILEILYQTESHPILNARLGLDVELFFDLYSKVSENKLDITSSGSGFSDPYIGLYLQWEPIMWANRPLFVHKFEFAASFPAGKFNKNFTFNPGNGLYYINPNWSATLYLMPRWATSWNLNYVWSSVNKHNGVQPGQAILLNYSMEVEARKNWWIAVNGYFLQQFTDTKVDGVAIPGRRDRVFAIGPGMLYSPREDMNFFAHLYFESKARNITQGISLIISFNKNF